MKNLVIITSALLLFAACSSPASKTDEKKTSKKATTLTDTTKVVEKTKNEQTDQKQKLTITSECLDNPTVFESYKRLLTSFSTIPYFFLKDSVPFFYAGDKERQPSRGDRFAQGVKYGLVNETDTLIPVRYDKIYMLDQIKTGYVEVRNGQKMGLFAYEYGIELPAEFDYLFPAAKSSMAVAIGIKGNEQYEIYCDGNSFLQKNISFNFSKGLRYLTENAMQFRKHQYVTTYFKDMYPIDPITGRGVYIPSSFAETQLGQKDVAEDLILQTQTSISFGTDKMGSEIKERHGISERIVSFIVRFWRSGIDARNYASESVEVLVYDNETKRFEHKKILSSGYSDAPCRFNSYHVKNDSIIEILRTDSYLQYTWAPKYNYLKIGKNGSITELKSNRVFSFTQFVSITPNYLEHCLARQATEQEIEAKDDFNIVSYEHFSVDDLDIMRNEIFADYGYRFKSKKWQEYFAKFEWYKPEHDNVDDLLSETEKENIKVILKRKNEMKGKEDRFTKPTKGVYVAAG